MPPLSSRFSILLFARFMAGAVLLSLPLRAGEKVAAGEAMRVLQKNCFSCHNEEKRKGGLSMLTREALLEGGDSGAALAPGAPEESPIITSLAAGADPHMPPKKQLQERHVQLLKQWVAEGAAWDSAALAESSMPRAVTLSRLPAAYHPVLAMALSPDGKRLAVGCGNELVIYDASSAKLLPLRRGSAHPDAVQSITWNAEGSRVATGAFRRVVIWNAESLEVEHALTSGLTDRIAALRFLPDGQQLVIADGRTAQEGTVRIADVASGGIVRSWPAHDDTIFDLAVSSDGQTLATAGGDKLVKVWDLHTQAEIARLEGHVAQVLAISFDEAGAQLVSGGADRELKVWDVKTRERIITLGKHSAAINAVSFTSAGAAVLAVTDAGTALRYTELKRHGGAQSSDSGKERKLEGSADAPLYCVTASADGERTFAGSHEGRVFCWSKDKLVETIEVSGHTATASAQ